jgi:hypothetical protein
VAVSDGSLSSNTRFVLTVNSPPAPEVILTAPTNGASYVSPATVTLAADVTSHGNLITKAQFFHGAILLGEDTTAPYDYTWNSVSAGNYSLRAQVVYGADRSVASAPVNVIVAAAPNSSGLTLGSASGSITAPFVVTDGMLSQPAYTSVTAGGRAVYNFTLSTAGDYLVSAFVSAPDGAANSFFVNLNAEPTDPTMIWDIPAAIGLTNRAVSWRGGGTHESNQFAPKIFTLAAGTHALIVRGREGNCQLGTITLAPITADLTFPATSGAVSSPFTITNTTIYQPTHSSATDGGRAAYNFLIGTAGDYVVSAQVNAPNDSADSFFVNIDAEPTDPEMIWDIPLTSGLAPRTVSWRGDGTYDNAQFAPKVFNLSAGMHTLIVRGREANCQLGTITLAPFISPPGNLRVLQN